MRFNRLVFRNYEKFYAASAIEQKRHKRINIFYCVDGVVN